MALYIFAEISGSSKARIDFRRLTREKAKMQTQENFPRIVFIVNMLRLLPILIFLHNRKQTRYFEPLPHITYLAAFFSEQSDLLRNNGNLTNQKLQKSARRGCNALHRQNHQKSPQCFLKEEKRRFSTKWYITFCI